MKIYLKAPGIIKNNNNRNNKMSLDWDVILIVVYCWNVMNLDEYHEECILLRVIYELYFLPSHELYLKNNFSNVSSMMHHLLKNKEHLGK